MRSNQDRIRSVNYITGVGEWCIGGGYFERLERLT